PIRRSTTCSKSLTASTASSSWRPSGRGRSTPTTPSSARACWSTSGRWSRPACRRSPCRSRCGRSGSGCCPPWRRRPADPLTPGGNVPARIVLGVGAGIAAYKACELLRRLTEDGHQVRVVPTRDSLRFVGAATWAALSGQPAAASVFHDVHEVPHVRLGQEADLVFAAPATADLLARAASGQADDLLTSVLLTAPSPVAFPPAL